MPGIEGIPDESLKGPIKTRLGDPEDIQKITEAFSAKLSHEATGLDYVMENLDSYIGAKEKSIDADTRLNEKQRADLKGALDALRKKQDREKFKALVNKLDASRLFDGAKNKGEKKEQPVTPVAPAVVPEAKRPRVDVVTAPTPETPSTVSSPSAPKKETTPASTPVSAESSGTPVVEAPAKKARARRGKATPVITSDTETHDELRALHETGEALEKKRRRKKTAETAPQTVEGEPTPGAIAEAAAVIESLPEQEKKSVFRGLLGSGYAIREMKSNVIASLFEKLGPDVKKIAKKLENEKGFETEDARRGVIAEMQDTFRARFSRGFSKDYRKEAKSAEIQKNKVYEKGGLANGLWGARHLAQFGLLVSRPFMKGIEAFNPFRTAGLGAMFLGRSFKGLKEAQLDSYSRIEKNRLDEEQALDEVEKIYADLKAKGVDTTDDTAVTKEALETVRLERLTKELAERLNPENLSALKGAERFVGKSLSKTLTFLSKQLEGENVMNIKNISEDKKNTDNAKLMKKWAEYLNDVERIVEKGGRVDVLAYALRKGEKTAQFAAGALSIEALASLCIDTDTATEKMTDWVADKMQSDVPALAGTLDEASDLEAVAGKLAESKTLSSEHVVAKGETTWGIIKGELERRGVLATLEKGGQKDYLLDALKDRLEHIQQASPEELKAMGISSLDIDTLKVGDTLNVNLLIDEETLNQALEKAEHLSPKDIEAIESYEHLRTETVEIPPIDASDLDEPLARQEFIDAHRTIGPDPEAEYFMKDVPLAEHDAHPETPADSEQVIVLNDSQSREYWHKDITSGDTKGTLERIFKTNSLEQSEYEQWKEYGARRFINTLKLPGDTGGWRLQSFLKALEQESGEHPRGGFWRRNETVEGYIARATAVIKEMQKKSK